ncbi:ribose transport system ATP-binding protein/rhamnose transport system ATP-binding protein [Seinonella peptonophila]|uniref:Ribose transport system ATP-binding protein/rhamnose transport system ATP-binding protein n=1 Tax=Seinonella peptonophila TaxID=112248 RepID=A0A1M4Y7E0_9BACL|nr:sugar ABC transporter ATP-binding protein [Seinonella peptonophila]SHF01727.1 ribose transport system ATP-binding protein/rhamnose transport system ATP-binding protein [Seinonella peptonophila]
MSIEEQPICRLDKLTKTFGGIHAVDQVDLEVYRGEVHALLGENGAGKSTLMKLLHGLYTPDGGEILWDGQPVEFRSPHDAEKTGIAMVPQELDLFSELTIAENLFLGRLRPRTWWGGFDWKSLNEQAKEMFESLGVSFDVSMQVKYLSIANQQLVQICRALMGNAQVVIMDEPTASLSEKETEKLFQIIDDLKKRKVGVIYISHRLEEIFQIADRVTVLRDGKQVTTGEIKDFHMEQLVSLMVGRSYSQLFQRKSSKIGKVLLTLKDFSLGTSFQKVNLVLREGEIVGLSGLVGAGRTELAQAIFGLRKSTNGEMFINDSPILIRSPEEAFQQGIAYVPEERRSQGLILPFTISQNINLSSLRNLAKYGLRQTEKEEQIAEKFSRLFSIRGATIQEPVSRLSGGNQQKVVFSKALAREPQIILLDEPTRGVDIGGKSEIYQLMDELAGQGKAILLISSELPEILSMSDRIVVMREGRITGEFDAKHATAEKITAAATGVVSTSHA